MICAAFGAIAVVIKRHRDRKEWHLPTAAADLAGRQILFDEDDEGPPWREAPVRFPGSSVRRLSGRQATGGQGDAGEGRRSRATPWGSCGFAGGLAARSAVIQPRFRSDRAAPGADLRNHPVRTGRRRARPGFSSSARLRGRKIVRGPFMNRQRMPVARGKTGERGETYDAMFSLFITR